MSHDIAAGTVDELVPVAQAAVATQARAVAVRDIRRALLLQVRTDIFRACDIAAEAIVQLAEASASEGRGYIDWPPAAAHIRLADDMPGFGGEDADRARRHADAELRGGR